MIRIAEDLVEAPLQTPTEARAEASLRLFTESLQTDFQSSAVLSRRPHSPRRARSHASRAASSSPSLALQRFAADEPFVPAEGNLRRGYHLAKRLLDVVGAIVLLILLAPAMLTALVVLTMTTRGKPIFTQERVGHLGRRFRMYKFRTMRLDADRLQHLVVNEKDGPIFKNRRDPRITRVGRWLRKTSLDETPQLFNVLAGSMSLVGPRPPVPSEVAKYKPWQRRRLAVKPGLTCLWQVSGRSNIGFEDWVRMDLWYLRNQCVWTDLKLLLRTPYSVLTGRGAC